MKTKSFVSMIKLRFGKTKLEKKKQLMLQKKKTVKVWDVDAVNLAQN